MVCDIADVCAGAAAAAWSWLGSWRASIGTQTATAVGVRYICLAARGGGLLRGIIVVR